MPLASLSAYLLAPVYAGPLRWLRVVYPLAMLVSTVRFVARGWVQSHYLDTRFAFKYYGFAWVQTPPAWALYSLHGLMVAACLGMVATGWRLRPGKGFRAWALVLFLSFTYVQLIDLTYYLNHYYLAALIALLLAAVPQTFVNGKLPRWQLGIFRVQIGFVYVYAGLAKINADWLLNALPLKLWLPAHSGLPFIGPLLALPVTAYLFSWGGMVYDCLIPFALMSRRLRWWALGMVVVFHTLVGVLFPIGVFPLLMIVLAPVLMDNGQCIMNNRNPLLDAQCSIFEKSTLSIIHYALSIYLAIQILFPLRHWLYPGSVYWHEQGYRFSWRVMLMEKAGTATFYVRNTCTGREGVADNRQFLNAMQEQQMATQPDMILQFAHHLGRYYQRQSGCKQQVRCEALVTLNGRPSRELVDSKVDLMKVEDGMSDKGWVMK